MRVLIVEDSRTQAEELRLILGAEGFEAAVAADGELGWEAFLSSEFDLVLSDVQMPGLSGYELCRRIKTHAKGGKVPVILLTSLSDPLAIIQGLEAQADNYVTKPFEPGYLVGRIRHVLAGRAAPERAGVALEVSFMGHRFAVSSEREHILELLLSTFEDIVRTYRELQASQASLAAAKAQLEVYARQLEGRVRVSEELHRRLMEQASDAILLLDGRGNVVEANHQAELLSGRLRTVLRGRSWLEIVAAEQQEALRAPLRALPGERLRQDDVRIQRPDGSVVVADLSAAAAEVDGEAFTLVIARDMTERRQAEAALRLSEERFRQIAENVREVFWIRDARSSRVLYASPAFEEVWGRDCASLYRSSRLWLDSVHPDDRSRVADAAASRQARAGYDETYRIRRPDGSERWVRERAFPVRDASGQVYRIAGVAEDITEQKLSEEARRESEEKARLLLESTAEGIYGIDLEGTCFFCNPACVRTLGHAAESDLVGRNMHERIHHERPDGEPYPQAECRILRAVRAGEGVHAEDEVFWRADGSSFQVEYWSTPIRRDGGIIGAVVAFLDITSRKKLEQQFLQSQKMEAFGRLAGGVAHDFNNILTAISGYSELVLETLGPGDARRSDVDEIRKSAERASALTRQLLAFSRKQTMRPRLLDLNAVLSDMEGMLRRILGERVELKTVLRPGLGFVRADPTQVEQVLLNLAVNARDAMPEGGRLVLETAAVRLDEAYCRPFSDVRPGRYVMAAASDTGCGMDAATKARLFEPFFTTKPVGQGTGLGLSTVYGIVKQSGGHIAVYSEPGKGSTFKFYLPVAEETEGAAEPSAERGEAVTGTETVLLVEDDEAVRSLAARVLKSCGFTVLEAANGREAVRLCETHPGAIHLLLTDLVTPGLDGSEAARLAASLRPGLRALFVSGYTHEAVAIRGGLPPGAAFLEKPFSPESLARKVREVLDLPVGRLES